MAIHETEVAIVGGGAMGLATARVLASAGRRVVVVEQFRVGHVRGSSHGTSRIFRLVYDDLRFAELARAALSLWRQLEHESGERLLTTTGSLDVGSNLTAFAETAATAGVAHELLDARELRRRLPGLHPAPGDQCLLQPDGGVIHADRALRVLRGAATAHGAELLEKSRVRELDTADSGVTLRGEGLEVRAETAVVAAGAWSGPLLAQVGIDVDLRPTRETIAYLRCDGAGALPTVIDHDAGIAGPGLPRRSDVAYGLVAPGVGLKVGVHKAGGPTDPDSDALPDEPSVAAAVEWAARLYGLDSPELRGADSCIYTNTDDDRFVLERRGRLVVAAACSGHGFKFVPEVGRRVAGLATEPLSA